MIKRSLSHLVRTYRLEITLGIVFFCLVFLLLLGKIETLNPTQLRNILFLLVTVSGIILGMIFSSMISKYYDTKTKLDTLLSELRNKQRRLILFRELCHESEHSWEIWRGLDCAPSNISYNEFRSNWEHLKGKKYVAAILLNKALYELGLGCYYEYHKGDEGKRIVYSFEEIKRFQELANEIWYGLQDSGARRSIEEFLRRTTGDELRLIRNQKYVELLAQEVFVSKFNRKFTSLDYWEELGGEIYCLCDDILDIHRRIYHFSPVRYLREYKNIALVLFLGILAPLILTIFKYPSEIFVTLTYIVFCLFIISVIAILKIILGLNEDDFYKKNIENMRGSLDV